MMEATNGRGMNALELLKHDHDEVDEMFKQFEQIKDNGDDAEKEQLVAQICDALTIHAQIEETIFYPAARRALQEKGQDLLDEAAVEHQTLKDIVGRLEMAPTSDPLYDAGVKVLSEYVKHHVKEEESELFPKVRQSNLDLQSIGQQLTKRKQELESQEGRSSSQEDRGMQRGQGRAAPGERNAQQSMSRSRSTH
ncbi:MAG TPA: hemerythrin domain-containing protein [Casimicrobiaceae bacterium]|nr:hemerythrin domain-containing protein [Casimicrobiaceae bacterium]HWD37024.1 hemerythrin domain-containing protein [Casimicrobiaceae bacterium]